MQTFMCCHRSIFIKFSYHMKQTILITGGTGMIGTHMTGLLMEKGHSVRYLSRSPGPNSRIPSFKWDIQQQTIAADALTGVDTIVHLAGAGVAGQKWSKERKKIILESRTQSTALLKKALIDHPHQIKTFISASATGYYGYDTGGVWKKEESRFGDDFLATVVKAWESGVEDLRDHDADLRIVKLRIGLVLSDKGGALKAMAKPIKMGVGAPLGPGGQYMSWVHLDDLCNMFVWAIENEKAEGVYNAVAPNPVTNAEMTKAIASTLGKPLLLPKVPGFALKLVLGEMASMLLGGSRISSQKIREAGFKHQFEAIGPALNNLLKSS